MISSRLTMGVQPPVMEIGAEFLSNGSSLFYFSLYLISRDLSTSLMTDMVSSL